MGLVVLCCDPLWDNCYGRSIAVFEMVYKVSSQFGSPLLVKVKTIRVQVVIRDVDMSYVFNSHLLLAIRTYLC